MKDDLKYMLDQNSIKEIFPPNLLDQNQTTNIQDNNTDKNQI